ncbi:HlyD family secretion protein [Parabacteroides pacaensis]|uniref:HlyD family secretion protein n=1 Tax=Parabacteroides pacaensis TaxID=2086575 RepID=UPI000D0F086C|nr:efflux RND transporter periplasmic adaptor subunit [Parabacteroides pacaensis]
MSENKKFTISNMMLAFIILIVVIGIVALAGFFLLKPGETIIMGQAEATVVRISGKIPGRIESYRFAEGDNVQEGDTVVFLSAPDIWAKLQQAVGAEQAVKAQDMKVMKGAREQQKQAVFEIWQKAKAGLEIARKSYERVQALYDKGVVSAQKRDEAEANYKAMAATEKAAAAEYQLVKEGADKEDKIAAAALVEAAKGAVAEVESYAEETALVTPISGQVSERFPEVGELVGSGAPIMNIVDLNDMWVVFNVREDFLGDLKMDAEVRAFIPALEKEEVTLKVYYMKDMGTYAAWKATKTRGQYDIKTFEVRARPVTPIKNLRPGMSVILIRK